MNFNIALIAVGSMRRTSSSGSGVIVDILNGWVNSFQGILGDESNFEFVELKFCCRCHEKVIESDGEKGLFVTVTFDKQTRIMGTLSIIEIEKVVIKTFVIDEGVFISTIQIKYEQNRSKFGSQSQDIDRSEKTDNQAFRASFPVGGIAG